MAADFALPCKLYILGGAVFKSLKRTRILLICIPIIFSIVGYAVRIYMAGFPIDNDFAGAYGIGARAYKHYYPSRDNNCGAGQCARIWRERFAKANSTISKR